MSSFPRLEKMFNELSVRAGRVLDTRKCAAEGYRRRVYLEALFRP
jgi:hypothetical protein